MSLQIIHKSLHRPQLFLGVDRDLAMYAILISMITALGGYNLVSLAAAAIFFVVAMRYLRRWAKMDPFLRDVFMRYIRHVNRTIYYSAKPSAFSSPPAFIWRRKKRP